MVITVSKAALLIVIFLTTILFSIYIRKIEWNSITEKDILKIKKRGKTYIEKVEYIENHEFIQTKNCLVTFYDYLLGRVIIYN